MADFSATSEQPLLELARSVFKRIAGKQVPDTDRLDDLLAHGPGAERFSPDARMSALLEYVEDKQGLPAAALDETLLHMGNGFKPELKPTVADLKRAIHRAKNPPRLEE